MAVGIDGDIPTLHSLSEEEHSPCAVEGFGCDRDVPNRESKIAGVFIGPSRDERSQISEGRAEDYMPKVLVADDSITVRKVAERLLTEAGMEVALAASGEEAMAYLSTEHPDFVISDVIMPDKSGYDVCRFVRSQSLLANTPVLLISGIVNEEVNRQAESCRANGVLKKPFQGASLQDRVREILSKQTEKGTAPEVAAVDARCRAIGDDARSLGRIGGRNFVRAESLPDHRRPVAVIP